MPMTSPSPSRGNSSRHHVLEVFELVRMICSHLEKKDYTSLLYVSRSVYDCALPIAWEDVDLRLALCLIPSIAIRLNNDEDSPESPSDSPDTANLSRFGMHAAFVRTLRISDPCTLEFTEQWPASGSNNPFPNLRYLVVSTAAIEAKDVDRFSRLLHPNLLGCELSKFSTQDCFRDLKEDHLWMDHEVCFGLINQVSRTSPDVQTLRIFPAEMWELNEVDCAPVYKSLASLCQLRSLSFSGDMVHESLLQAIGQLPCLETLSLCADGDNQYWGYDEDTLSLPDESFPSLRYLCLHGLCESTMERVCQAPPLFHRLITASIVFFGQTYDDCMGNDVRSKLAVKSIGQNSPCLEQLVILTVAKYGYFEVSWPIIEVFQQIPLRSLNLGRILFDSGNENEDESESDSDEEEVKRENTAARENLPVPEWTDLFAATPHLEELHIPRHRVRPDELRFFASGLPRLRLLIIGSVLLDNVELEEHGYPNSHEIILSSGSFFELQKESSEDSSSDVDDAILDTKLILPTEQNISNAARYVHSMWSNVRCQTHQLQESYQHGDIHDNLAAKLNKALDLLKSEK